MTQRLQIEGKQYFDEYILIAPGSDYGRAMWNDIDEVNNGSILDGPLKKCGKILEMIHHIHFSFAINKRIRLPLQQIWKRMYSLEQIKFDDSKKYCIIYTDVSAARTDVKYLESLSKRANVTLVLVMVNTMARRGSLILNRRSCFELIYSFDPKDCQKYGFIYHQNCYSKKPIDKGIIENDVFYVGVSKGRAEMLGEVYKRIVSGGANAQFYISGVKSNDNKVNGIHYNQWLSYAQILDFIRKTNCIVEIMDGEQEGVTLRTMEAICYNKKLLTNNQSMRNSKYYKSGNIQIFSQPNDIDVDFLKCRSISDYEYTDEFSPIHLIEHINRIKMEKD